MQLNIVARTYEKKIGVRLAQARADAKLSREKVLNLIYDRFGFYIHNCLYERIENGKCHPKAVYVVAICSVLSLDPMSLLE